MNNITQSSNEAILERLDQILERLDKFEARIQTTENLLHELPGIAKKIKTN